MSIVRVGSTSTYAAGWDAIFGGRAARPGNTGRTKARTAGRAATRKTAAEPRPVKAAKKARSQKPRTRKVGSKKARATKAGRKRR